MNKLTTFQTRFGDEGVTVTPAAQLMDRDRRVVELESKGYTLIQTLILPNPEKSSGNIGNVSIINKDAGRIERQLAIDGTLAAWATERMAIAVEEYGAGNVAICTTMRYQPPEESAYEPYEYMALYARVKPREYKPVEVR